MEYKMETRQCALHNCVGMFKVLEQDAQQYCSDFCEQSLKKKGSRRTFSVIAKVIAKTTEKLWDEQPKKEKQVTENVTTETCSAQNTERTKGQESMLSETRKLLKKRKFIEQNQEREQTEIIRKTAPQSIKENTELQKQTLIDSDNTENTMPETDHETPKELTNKDISATPQLDCTLPPMTIKLVESASMNLIDDTTQHLFGLMKGLTANAVPVDLQKTPTHIAETAVKCATEIRGLLKLKLEVIKVALEHGN